MAEMIAISALLWKAAEFLTQIRDGLYKGSTELDEFPIKVAILSAKHAQWTSLLQKFGMTEDEHLNPLIKAAVQILDKEQDYVARLQKSRFMRFRRKAFPGKLTWILSSLVDIVDASRQLLEMRVETNDLLVRSLRQTPCPLPFGPDRKYVPLLGSITKVQKALEDADGPCVLTLHGGPGIGKSSMVKYLALHYQQLRRQQMVSRPPTTLYFPDGVFYLFCGRGAQARVKQLQMNLLESLGGGFGSSSQSNGCTSAPDEEGEFVHLPSHDTKLRFCLAEQKSLVILDDVWEVEVMEKLLVPGENVKYLVTSQISMICSDATLIKLKSPNKAEARKILANYTEGLPTKGEFPDRIQSLTDAIIEELQCHPLSLANVGTSISRSRATDLGEWRVVKDSLWEYDELDENDVCISPLVYGSRYPLTLRASMMLMVDSLCPKARDLLFLTVLMKGPEIPEVLVKFFLKQIQPTGWRNRYRRDIKYLEDRSLVEYRCLGVYDVVPDEAHTNRPILVKHGLRSYYIRKNYTMDVAGIATEILSSGSGSNTHDGTQLIQTRSTEESLATIMSAMYFEKPFRDVVASKLERQIRIFNGGVIPRSMSNEVDVLHLMNRTKSLKSNLRSLVWLLNPDEEGGWKQQAHHYVKKIVIRLTFRKELDDESMAGLIQLPHTTTAACRALEDIVLWYFNDQLKVAFVDQTIAFSSAHDQTMKSLMCLLHDNAAAPTRCAAAVGGLWCVSHYENDDTILSIAKKWVEFLAKDSSTTLQTAISSAIVQGRLISRATVLVGEFPGLLDSLLMLTVEGRDPNVRAEAAKAIYELCVSKTMAYKIAVIPGALEILFNKFQARDEEYFGQRYYAGNALRQLFCIPENRVKFTIVHDSAKGLIAMLTSNPKSRSASSSIHYSFMAAEILANLAMTNDVRKTILATFPEVEEVLQRLQLSFLSRNYRPHESMYQIEIISRAMTILNPLQASFKMMTIPLPPPRACCQAYMGRVQAYREMQMYSEALAALNIAHEYYQQMTSKEGYKWREIQKFRLPQIFFKAMLQDYAGAMLDVDNAIQNYPNSKKDYQEYQYRMLLGERGVMKLLVGLDLVEALVDLDEALKLKSKNESYGYLKHRGLVKLMMGDEVGARADAESAFQLK